MKNTIETTLGSNRWLVGSYNRIMIVPPRFLMYIGSHDSTNIKILPTIWIGHLFLDRRIFDQDQESN